MESARYKIPFSVLTLSLVLLFSSTYADVLNVPDDYETIQEAIDASEDGDTVLVAPGEYEENINFDGKDIFVIGNPDDPSEVIIDGGGEARVVTFSQGESADALLSGFTIMNGSADSGGGILCYGSSPTLQNLIVKENEATSRGGGLSCSGRQNFVLRDIVFEDNSAMMGGGIYSGSTGLELCDVTITRNTASHGAGGVEVYGGGDRVEMTNVLIDGNTGDPVGGVYLDSVLEVLLTKVSIVANIGEGWSQGTRSRDIRTNISNSIFWGNEGNPISLGIPHGESGEIRLNISYTDLQFGSMGIDTFGDVLVNIGDGMLDEDPLFADPDEGDYHLTADSPCIDTGDPDSPEDPDGTRADMGAFYFDQLDVPKSKDVIPEDFKLLPAFPNPFNSTTIIRYSLPFPTHTSLAVYNPLGQRLRTLFEGYKYPGFHTVKLSADNLPSGLYFVKLEASGQVSSRKVMLVR